MNLLHEEKYVVIDIETTGNRIKSGDEIIQIGLCTIQGGEIIETFSSYVKPSIEIPPFIQKLTGITEVDVQDSPVIKELLPVIQEKMEGSILVAHNIHFDLGVLQHYLTEHDYPPFKGMIIDTVELSRILYPNRSGYRLSELAVDFQIQHETPHQADSDALATAKLFLLLCSRMRKLPLLTIQRMIPLAQSLYSDIELLFRKIEHEKCLRPVIQTEEEMEEFRHLVLRRKEEELNTSIENHFIEQIPIEEIKPSVILGSKIENYEYREAQDQLSEEILKAFQAEEHALFEAGTGTGKTLAYLLASIYWAKRTKSKVVISTHTIQLQEQIRDKEIPKLQEILPFTFEDALIKGRTHYLCLRKFEQSLYQTNEKNYDYELTKLQLLVWLTETETGDVEELNLPSGGKDYWLKIQSETDSCLHHKCPWFERCFYFRSRKKTQQADLIITNHSLLLADFEGQKLLPHYDYVILDEAHHVEQIASGQFGQNMTYTRLHFVLQRLYSEDKPTLTQRFLELLELSEEGFRVMPTVNEIQEQLQEMKSGIDQLFTHLYILAEKKQGNDRTDSRRAVRLIHPLEDEEEWYLVLQLTDQLRSRKDQLNHAYHTLVQWYDSLQAEWLHDLRSTYTDWSSAIRTLAEYIDQLEALILHYDRNHVYWIEYEPKGARNSSGVFQQPLEVTTFLQPLFQEKKSAILTSATLQVNRSFQYFIDQLGMPLERLRVQAFASPFDYSQQSRLLVAKEISSVQDSDEALFSKEIAESIIEIVKVTQGRMLVLFTSHHMLKMTHQNLKQALHEMGIFLYAQGIDSGSRGKLTKNFESQEQAILLGTNSFWEGVDLPGKQLSCLVIVKLPFTPPHTPYFEAKSEQLKESGKNPFMDYALPQAVIRFKQGFGRLIRRADDKGVVVVFDRRIIEARYGKFFLNSLPPLTVESLDLEGLIHDIQNWLG